MLPNKISHELTSRLTGHCNKSYTIFRLLYVVSITQLGVE
uniref:Uncharacterized protein n=1 Tax=Anguilla anguilla TaxID=7936 RepID=A0A0E9RX77_ANGAN